MAASSGIINLQEYRSLCSMSFREISTMTTQLSALEGRDNFNYLMALQDICSKLANPQSYPINAYNFQDYARPKRQRPPPAPETKRRKKRRKRPKKRKRPTAAKESEPENMSGPWWDIFGFFAQPLAAEAEEKVLQEENNYYWWDLLGVWGRKPQVEKSSAEDEYEYEEEYYDSDEEFNRRHGIDASEHLPFQQVFSDKKHYFQQNARQDQERKNQRLAFVNFVFPRNSANQFKQFHGRRKK